MHRICYNHAEIRADAPLCFHSCRCQFGDKPDDLIAGLADECHEIDWGDYSSLLKITADVEADGIVGLCDKAMMPVSMVSAELGLIGNPPESIEILLSKNKFRELQKRAGVFCPGHVLGEASHDLSRVLPTACLAAGSPFGVRTASPPYSLSSAVTLPQQ